MNKRLLGYAVGLVLSLVNSFGVGNLRTVNNLTELISTNNNPQSILTNYIVVDLNKMFTWNSSSTTATNDSVFESLYIKNIVGTNVGRFVQFTNQLLWINNNGEIEQYNPSLPLGLSNMVWFLPGSSNVLYRSGNSLVLTNAGTSGSAGLKIATGDGIMSLYSSGGSLAIIRGASGVDLNDSLTSGNYLRWFANHFVPMQTNSILGADDSLSPRYSWANVNSQSNTVHGYYDLTSTNYSRLVQRHTGTNGSVIFDSQSSGIAGAARDFLFQSNGVTVAKIAVNSGYVGLGSKSLMDDGTYKTPSAAFDVASAVVPDVFSDTNIVLGNISAGTNDIWTVPAGKYASIIRANFGTTNASSVLVAIKTNGVSYAIGGSGINVITNTAATLGSASTIYPFEAGETIQFIITTNGVNAWVIIRYWDKTVSWIKPFKYIVNDTNTNLLYTVSSGKMAYAGGASYLTPLNMSSGTFNYGTSVGIGSAEIQLFLVAPGELPSSTNRCAINSFGAGTSSLSLPPILPNYSIYMSSSIATNTLRAWGTFIEAQYPINP